MILCEGNKVRAKWDDARPLAEPRSMREGNADSWRVDLIRRDGDGLAGNCLIRLFNSVIL